MYKVELGVVCPLCGDSRTVRRVLTPATESTELPRAAKLCWSCATERPVRSWLVGLGLPVPVQEWSKTVTEPTEPTQQTDARDNEDQGPGPKPEYFINVEGPTTTKRYHQYPHMHEVQLGEPEPMGRRSRLARWRSARLYEYVAPVVGILVSLAAAATSGSLALAAAWVAAAVWAFSVLAYVIVGRRTRDALDKSTELANLFRTHASTWARMYLEMKGIRNSENRELRKMIVDLGGKDPYGEIPTKTSTGPSGSTHLDGGSLDVAMKTSDDDPQRVVNINMGEAEPLIERLGEPKSLDEALEKFRRGHRYW